MASASVPAQYPGQPTSEVRWSTSLFHCFSDMHSCCLTFWCPCVAFGRISEIADKGSSFWLNFLLKMCFLGLGLTVARPWLELRFRSTVRSSELIQRVPLDLCSTVRSSELIQRVPLDLRSSEIFQRVPLDLRSTVRSSEKVTLTCARHFARRPLERILTGFGCLYSCTYRAKLRKLYMLEESPCGDCCVHCFCELCALCQEYRELQNQGFDVSAGWDGNSQKNNQGVAMAPVVEGGMKR
ncbi:hypothetical protein I3843_05G170800 [Carya illinoinensis]|nr:hypothetical protein I3843_05G170800 [Carya illinoinensis]